MDIDMNIDVHMEVNIGMYMDNNEDMDLERNIDMNGRRDLIPWAWMTMPWRISSAFLGETYSYHSWACLYHSIFFIIF